jgi:hypothetical protein
MKGEVEDEHETRGVQTSMGYLQRALQATLTIWLSLTVVVVALFGLSESLRVAGVDRDENVQITFLVALGLILLTLWLLPRSLLTLKEEKQDGARWSYIQRVLHALAVMWAAVALLLLATLGLYAALSAAGVERNANLLITFLVALGLILLALRLLPRPLLTLKDVSGSGNAQDR